MGGITKLRMKFREEGAVTGPRPPTAGIHLIFYNNLWLCSTYKLNIITLNSLPQHTQITKRLRYISNASKAEYPPDYPLPHNSVMFCLQATTYVCSSSSSSSNFTLRSRHHHVGYRVLFFMSAMYSQSLHFHVYMVNLRPYPDRLARTLVDSPIYPGRLALHFALHWPPSQFAT